MTLDFHRFCNYCWYLLRQSSFTKCREAPVEKWWLAVLTRQSFLVIVCHWAPYFYVPLLDDAKLNKFINTIYANIQWPIRARARGHPHARIYIGVIPALIDKDTNINSEWRSNQFVENVFAKASLDTVDIPGMLCSGKACQTSIWF